MKIISIDFKADFGFFKKPDINDGIYLTFNMLHKPSILGIFGAILGLSGFQKYGVLPKYYQLLRNLQIGIAPLNSNNGNFNKTVIRYNNSVGYASQETGGNLIIDEQTLIKPSYRVFIKLDDTDENFKKLDEYLKNNLAVYIPYLGKNEYSLWWNNYFEYGFEKIDSLSEDYKILTIFIKEQDNSIRNNRTQNNHGIFNILKNQEPFFLYFERLPVAYSEITFHYVCKEFVYTNMTFNKEFIISNLYKLKGTNEYIQLF